MEFQILCKSNFVRGKFWNYFHSKTFPGVIWGPTNNSGLIGSAVLTLFRYKHPNRHQNKQSIYGGHFSTGKGYGGGDYFSGSLPWNVRTPGPRKATQAPRRNDIDSRLRIGWFLTCINSFLIFLYCVIKNETFAMLCRKI